MWEAFEKGAWTLHGLSICHVCAAIRYAHSVSGKKLPHPVLAAFLPDDPDMLPMEVLKKQAGLLFAFWGVLSEEVVINMEVFLGNCMLKEVWSSKARWREEGERLPGMRDCASGASFDLHCKEASVDPEEIVSAWERNASLLRKRKKGLERADLAPEVEAQIRLLEEKVDLVTGRKEATPWLFLLLEEAYGKEVGGREGDATVWLLDLAMRREEEWKGSERRERTKKQKGAQETGPPPTLSSLSASTLLKSVAEGPTFLDLALEVPSLSKKDVALLCWHNLDKEGREEREELEEEDAEEYAVDALSRILSPSSRLSSLEVVLSSPHVSAGDLAVSSIFKNQIGIVADLLSLGAVDPNAVLQNLSLLKWAESMQRSEIVDLLLENGAE